MNTNDSKWSRLMKAVVAAVADSGDDEWPPKCSTFLYQPVHPNAIKHEQEKVATTEKTEL